MNKTVRFAVSALLAASLFFGLTACNPKPKEAPAPMLTPVTDNYRTYYQIFVGSFSDSNNDGIGDLRGVINRLDYLNDGSLSQGKSLGVQGIWLSPIFSSPSYHKYDATDYYSIDWRFGTEADLKELITLCHERNVQVILDLVLNHTSSQHPWFVKFKEARIQGDTENPYYDYYSCVKTADKVGGVTYQKIAGVDCWYECNFSTGMPELNFDNPEVRQKMLDVAKYYLDLGVDGFRFDAVKYIYYGDTDRSVEFWKWYMEELHAINPDIYCVGECWSGENEILQYYTAELNCFNFAMAQAEGVAAKAAKGSSMATFTNYVVAFQNKVQEKYPHGMAMSFLSNHDMDRIAGAFSMDGYMRMAANLYLLSPGSPVIYYGEELGMRGSRGGESTDANRRLKMLWGDEDMIANPVGSTYADKNQISTTVASQKEDKNSLLNYYCELLFIRHKYEAIPRGDYSSLSCGNKNLGGFKIDYQGQTLGLIHNNSLQEITYDLASCADLGGYTFSRVGDFIGMGTAKLEGTVLTLGPQTSVILQ